MMWPGGKTNKISQGKTVNCFQKTFYPFAPYCDTQLTCVIKSYVSICYVMLCYIMLCYVMLCYVMLCYVMLCYVVICYVNYGIICYALLDLCYVVICYVSYVMLCYVMLCYVMLCYMLINRGYGTMVEYKNSRRETSFHYNFSPCRLCFVRT